MSDASEFTRNVKDVMTPGEVAALFRVDAKTVNRWGKTGKLSSFRTPGGHRRYRGADVRAYVTTYFQKQTPTSPSTAQ